MLIFDNQRAILMIGLWRRIHDLSVFDWHAIFCTMDLQQKPREGEAFVPLSYLRFLFYKNLSDGSACQADVEARGSGSCCAQVDAVNCIICLRGHRGVDADCFDT